MKKKTVIAYWLMPAAPERELFVEIVRILARKLDAPRFEPHLTLCVVPYTPVARQWLKQIKAGPIRLRVRAVSYSNRFTKTLFVRFHGNRALDDLTASLRRAAKLSAGALRDPHVSLLYRRMPPSAKKELAATVRLPFQEVTFDSIKVLRCPAPTETRGDVEAWRVVASKKLRD